jgi:hypothetical protein
MISRGFPVSATLVVTRHAYYLAPVYATAPPDPMVANAGVIVVAVAGFTRPM